MKKNLQLFTILFLSFFAANSQVIDTTSSLVDGYNKWSIELSVGQSKGVKPYADGYYSSNPEPTYFIVKIRGAETRRELS